MIDRITSRLQTAPAGFAEVLVSESLDALSADIGRVKDGAVVVVPWRERARPNRNAAGPSRQLIEVQFVVVMVSRRSGDRRGAARATGFDGIRDQVEALLAGWQPEPGAMGCALVGGETSGLGNGVSILAQTWQTSRFLTGSGS